MAKLVQDTEVHEMNNQLQVILLQSKTLKKHLERCDLNIPKKAASDLSQRIEHLVDSWKAIGNKNTSRAA